MITIDNSVLTNGEPKTTKSSKSPSKLSSNLGLSKALSKHSCYSIREEDYSSESAKEPSETPKANGAPLLSKDISDRKNRKIKTIKKSDITRPTATEMDNSFSIQSPFNYTGKDVKTDMGSFGKN